MKQRTFIPAVLGLLTLNALNAGEAWLASPEILPGNPGKSVETVRGHVFEDTNGDGRRQAGEAGVASVKVSNGLAVVLTDESGFYELPVRPDMNLMVVQPSGWEVPVDERMVPQFSYIHKEGGSPNPLRFGGLEDTGPAPAEVNFPLRRKEASKTFRAAVIGDSQTYSNAEIGYFRDSAVVDMLSTPGQEPDFLLFVGDVVGDDLGLLDRLLRVGAVAGKPQWLVHGNHDLDFDAVSDADSSDTWRRVYGPNYYAFEEGGALFVVLDNVVYPCGEEDMAMPGRDFCAEGERPAYNGRVPGEQMQWLENILEKTPKDRLVVFAHHIPFVSFVDPDSTKHQTDNLLDIYSLVNDRKALSLSGHTHTMENHAPGQMFDGWDRSVGIDEVKFRHIIAGAASGSWYLGDLNYRGVPMGFQRMGSPKGVLMMDFEGSWYREHYLGGGVSADKTLWADLNTPRFRNWFETLMEWSASASRQERFENPPPLSINDLGDNRFLTPEDLREGVWVTANVWAGSAENTVSLSLNGGNPVKMERTQSGSGEGVKTGSEWADPFASQRQLGVARVALRSTSGVERNQGYEAFKGSRMGPAHPQPMGRVADRNMHLWRARLPADLPAGTHKARIFNTDRNGKTTTEVVLFEVAPERPPLRWRTEPWQ